MSIESDVVAAWEKIFFLVEGKLPGEISIHFKYFSMGGKMAQRWVIILSEMYSDTNPKPYSIAVFDDSGSLSAAVNQFIVLAKKEILEDGPKRQKQQR